MRKADQPVIVTDYGSGQEEYNGGKTERYLFWKLRKTYGEEEIQKWMKEEAPDEDQEFYTMDRYRYLLKVRIYLLEGRYERAVSLIEKLLYYAGRHERDRTDGGPSSGISKRTAVGHSVKRKCHLDPEASGGRYVQGGCGKKTGHESGDREIPY